MLKYLREKRASVGISSVLLTFISLSGVALVTDHGWLVYQRDLLKYAADSAVIAATLRLQELPVSMSDDEVDGQLQGLAERYVRSNLVGNLSDQSRTRMHDTLEVDVNVNRGLGTVAVTARADLGGTLLSKRILGYAGPEIAVKSGAEGAIGATELVLAIDVTTSMSSNLNGARVGRNHPSSRISIVKEAAEDLIDILAAHENSSIAVGLVPWSYRVRLDRATRMQWEADGWAVYPTERTYPHPTRGPPGSDRYLPETQSLPTQASLPNLCRAWAGCLDMRVADATLRPSFSTALPWAEPFVMNFFTERTSSPGNQYASYACQDYTRVESVNQGGEAPLCYDLDSAPPGQHMCGSGDIQAEGPWRLSPQDNCRESEVMPLNPDLDAVRTAVRRLQAGGYATYSSVGIAWAMRLLASSWREVWGHSVHPMDHDTDVQKVIVLLTDGEDNHLSNAYEHRRQGCTAAKDEGIMIFTIAAMHPQHVGNHLASELRECSSQDEDPDGTYVFVNNADPDALREAFADIGRQIVRVRRTY